MVSHHPAKSGGYRLIGSEDMFWFYHVISQTHVTEESRDFLGRSQSRLSHQPTKFGAHRYCDSKIRF